MALFFFIRSGRNTGALTEDAKETGNSEVRMLANIERNDGKKEIKRYNEGIINKIFSFS